MNLYKYLLFVVSLICFSDFMLYAQPVYFPDMEIGNVNGRVFQKRIENNLLTNMVLYSSNGKTERVYNIKSKTDIEILFFGKINSKVEFFIEPTSGGAYGFRIARDSVGKPYVLDSRRVSNWEEATPEEMKELAPPGFAKDMLDYVISEFMDTSVNYDRTNYAKLRKESIERYNITSNSLSVDDNFVEKLHNIISCVIKKCTVTGEPSPFIEGYTATLRCVVGDEVWTLTIQEPDGIIKQLVDICNQIIKDVETHTFNESKYIESLDGISQPATAERE